jgi:parallel beta-helix repeat protein
VAIGTGSGAQEVRFPCGFDVSALWVTGIIATDVDADEPEIGFTDSTLAQATDYFKYGVVECTAGVNLGQTREISTFTTGGVFVLQFAFANPISIGDEFRARPGCSHQVEGANGCRFWWDFDWVNHYRGEPYTPVADAEKLLTPGSAIGRASTPTGTGETPTPTPVPTPEPPPSGGGTTPGSPPARTVGATVVTPTLTAGSGAAASNAAAINTAFSGLPVGGGIVRIPAGTWYIDPVTSIHPVSNSRLDLATNSATLQAAYTALDHKNVVTISGVHDVEVVGGSIIGYRDSWSAISGTTSEWGHGILCTGSASAVTIKNVSISKCVGDAVSIGLSCSDVTVDNCVLTNCRRQGVSTGGDNITITNNRINHISGTAPQAGIDVEVDNPSVNSAVTTLIDGNTIEYCSGPCVNAYRNTHSITLTNNTLRYSTYGFLTTDSDTGTISGNAIEHNKYQGVKLTTGSTGWAINTNDFFNNNTSVRGVIETGSFTTRTGTSSATADHLSVSSDSSATVGSNDYGP